MTLIIALSCKDGVIMASDGQATTPSTGGPIRRTFSKIMRLGDNKLWSASGSVGMIQKILNAFDSTPKELLKASINHPQLRQAVFQITHQIRVNELKRHRSLYGQGRDREADVADLLIVEYQQNPKIWHINPDCRDEFLEDFGYGCSGNGDIFAHTLLFGFQIRELSIEQGVLLAYKVIQEAINVGAFGLGEPIDIWTIGKEGPKQKTPEEIMGLKDTYNLWKEAEVETFKKLFVVKGRHD